jgi:hypothetical protein
MNPPLAPEENAYSINVIASHFQKLIRWLEPDLVQTLQLRVDVIALVE